MKLGFHSKLASAFIFVGMLSGCNFEVETTTGGKVVSDPSGIDCRTTTGTCVIENYEKLGDGQDKVIVTLKAIPDDGYTLSHWEGDCFKTRRHECKVHMNGELFVKAVFAPEQAATTPAPNKTVRFIAIGDMGEGNYRQFQVAEAFRKECDQRGGCDFAIGLGDNIYDDQPGDEYSSAFDLKFETPYRNVNFPFYMSLGNHDNDILIDGTGGSNIGGDIQVDYHYRENRPSENWKMPARFYHFKAPSDSAPLVDFFALDSNPMNSAPDINPDYEINQYKKMHGEWLDQSLTSSKAPWKIAYTHHPYISNGDHGNAGNYDGLLPLGPLTARIGGEIYRKWFEQHVCNKVDIFFAGHDHDMQILHSVPECGKTFFVISGAAAKTRELKDEERNVAYYQLGKATGFILAEIKGNNIDLRVYTVDDNGYQLDHVQSFIRRQ
ncbi:Uncharacterised protein [BD1-7 clade bacterium]|uniref:Calcineurin-like phosphoesterase domain-containing protein n=1 Tax=BD1-7 clade bacterium TaxID=2029982 RepID=A0A5S9QSZ6_9GAMM|nr:Uncharacterised protein [BD1-7 clade bacterium]